MPPALDPRAERLGRAIMTLRTAQKLSRKELAERAKLSYPYVAELETGAKVPSARALDAIAGALQTSSSYLLAQRDAMPEVETSGATVSGPAAAPGVMNYAAVAGTTAPTAASERERSERDLIEQIIARVMVSVEQDVRERLERDLPALIRDATGGQR